MRLQRAVIAGLLVLAVNRAALAQGEDRDTRAAAIESYLDRLGLTSLLAEQLQERLASAAREDKPAIADRLAKVYAALLAGATSAEDAKQWEERSRSLLSQVPEADSFELRINLNKTIYLKAEDTAERHRLRLATPEEVGQAQAALEGVARQCREVASKLHGRVQQLERLEATLEGTDALAAELSESRRLRSLAFYYAGWASTYVAQLSGQEPPAVEAMKDFGWLLNSSGGKLPTVEKAPGDLMKYEHIARAAIGCAMCASVRGNDVEAVRWLELVSSASEIPASVRDQLTARRMIVYGAARRWADLERTVRLTRRVPREAQATENKPLTPVLARLLAVIALEADKRYAAAQIEGLAKIALGDLVAQKQAGQVLDLVKRFGTAPLGDSGFIVHYVRGLQQFDEARGMHVGADQDPPQAPSPEAMNAYRAAANLLRAAVEQSDVGDFVAERARAMVTMGRALMAAGEVMQAGDQFASAWSLIGQVSGQSELAEEALWLGVLAFDQASRDAPDADEPKRRRTELGAAYLQAFPESTKAHRLVLLQASAGELNDDEALKVLAGVGKDSPMYEAARRQVARILYTKVRSASPGEREFAITRFVSAAEETLTFDLKKGASGTSQEARLAAERVVGRVRQLLDAVFLSGTPDVDRAESLLTTMTRLAAEHRIDLTPHQPEISFRRVQLLAARGDDGGALTAADALAASPGAGGTFAAAADRALFRRFVSMWNTLDASSRPTELASRIVRVGVRVVDRLGSDAEVMNDSAVINAYAATADAALAVHQSSGDVAMRDLALRLDGLVISHQPRLLSVLRRIAIASASAGDFARSRTTWTQIAESATSGTLEWFEARYHLLKLLSESDVGGFRAMMDQQKALYPEYGPEPWGERIRALESAIPTGGTP